MSASLRLAAGIVAIALAACGSESPTPDTATRTAKTAPHDSATAPPPARTTETPPIASAATVSGKLEPSDANVATLLEGGPALTALPTRATDTGSSFDPSLRSKLAPAKPTPP